MNTNCCERRDEKQKSNTIDYLRATAIILVVIQHAMSYGKAYFGAGSAGYAHFITIINFVNVPLFFMIAGYLCHSQDVLKYYKKKFFQIFIPFLVFTSLKFVCNLFFEQFSHSSNVGIEFLTAYVFGDYYWFSYALLLMCLIAPLLWKLKNKVVLIGVFLLLVFFNIANGFLRFISQGGPFQIFSVIIYGTWFLLGYVLRQLNAQNLLNIKPVKHITLLISITASFLVIFLSIKGMFIAFLSKFIVSVSISYILLYIFSSMHFKIPLLNYISNYSYQIFLLDSFVKVVLFMIASKLVTISTPIIILLAILNILISMIISFIVHKIKYAKTLLGLS
ncbi:MAG: acyltransferase [Ruminococcaceae bacterium]|nr:acyltransferase [Oscillospiraceae bacterium]